MLCTRIQTIAATIAPSKGRRLAYNGLGTTIRHPSTIFHTDSIIILPNGDDTEAWTKHTKAIYGDRLAMKKRRKEKHRRPKWHEPLMRCVKRVSYARSNDDQMKRPNRPDSRKTCRFASCCIGDGRTTMKGCLRLASHTHELYVVNMTTRSSYHKLFEDLYHLYIHLQAMSLRNFCAKTYL